MKMKMEELPLDDRSSYAAKIAQVWEMELNAPP
jgi:hypothetical protein